MFSTDNFFIVGVKKDDMVSIKLHEFLTGKYKVMDKHEEIVKSYKYNKK